MTYTDKRMNPLHFGSDPADIRIWIWINLESGNPNSSPESLLLEILALSKVCAVWAQSSLLL